MRNVKAVERNAKRENGLHKTFRMLSSTIVIIQLRPMALCMPRILHTEGTSVCPAASFITEFADFPDFTYLKRNT